MPKKKTFTFERLQQLGDTKYNNKFTYISFEGEIGNKDEFKYIITVLYRKDTMFYEAYESEQRLQKLVKNYTYVPNDKFKGYTECFNTKCLDNLQSSLGVILEVKSP